MNVLIIVANPRKESFSFAMADRYRELAMEKNNTVEVIDLYRDEHQQPFYTYKAYNEPIITPEIKYFQEKILWADELVFVFPYWWGSMPAILKNFIDSNFSRGFAFNYVNSRPVGLLMGKTVTLLSTTGAPTLFYKIMGVHRRLTQMFKKQIIEFCGMTLKSSQIFGSVDTSGKNTSKILNSITF
jgi:NAD(P)H dehydrogenase (quinone)